MRDPHTVHLLKADKTLTAKHVLIATGGRPWIPEEVEGAISGSRRTRRFI